MLLCSHPERLMDDEMFSDIKNIIRMNRFEIECLQAKQSSICECAIFKSHHLCKDKTVGLNGK